MVPALPNQTPDSNAKKSVLKYLDRTSHGEPGHQHLKGAEGIARQIEREVVSAGWPLGQSIGTESELIDRFGVSRATVREAIRILERHMVARMRPGPRGGLVVSKPDPSMVTRASALYLDYKRVKSIHLYNARSSLELKCLELAMEGADTARFESLMAIVDAESRYDPVEIISHSHEFHLEIARITNDPALELFVDVLLQLTGDHAPPPELGAIQSGGGVFGSTGAHARIASAMLSGETARASELLLDHLWWVTAGLDIDSSDRPLQRRPC